jgi:poly-gamma-glutamate capsule biosynthesis protein CapA/YwtB (metallophosphatase superfamily)
MRHDLRNGQDPNFLSVVEGVRSADIAFANFEGAVRPPDAELPSEYHPSDAVTLDCLKWMGFNLLSLANNHAFEAAEAGIQYTEELARQKGFTTAGTGATLEEASRAGVLEISGTKIALIAMDTANCQTEKAVAGPHGAHRAPGNGSSPGAALTPEHALSSVMGFLGHVPLRYTATARSSTVWGISSSIPEWIAGTNR